MASPQPRRWTPEPRETFNADTARKFSRYSGRNAAQLADALPCDCQPYVDILTFGRWKGLDRAPAKGQKAHHIACKRLRQYTTDDDPETVLTASIKYVAHVFCRCQTVERRGRKGGRR